MSVQRSEAVRERLEIVFVPPRCDRCGTELASVFTDSVGPDGLWNDLQAEGALVVRLDGGYQMAVDPLDQADIDALTFLLCNACARKFVAENDWLSDAASFLSNLD